MTKFSTLFLLLVFSISCNQKKVIENEPPKAGNKTEIIYSKNVADSFYVSVSLPADYDSHSKRKYPVVYVLDANLYFDIYSTIIRKYAEVGLTASPIIIGVGYKNFQTMDSLRNRDYTFPQAFPEYEMSVSGKADRFFNFLAKELIPQHNKEYNTDTANRILAGHSLGGYFTLYALLQSLLTNEQYFTSYMAASPSLDYNNGYLLKQITEAKGRETGVSRKKVYVTYGALEDAPDDNESMKVSEVLSRLKGSATNDVNYKFSVFSDLDHMDTQIPTFIKGLQWIFEDAE